MLYWMFKYNKFINAWRVWGYQVIWRSPFNVLFLTIISSKIIFLQNFLPAFIFLIQRIFLQHSGGVFLFEFKSFSCKLCWAHFAPEFIYNGKIYSLRYMSEQCLSQLFLGPILTLQFFFTLILFLSTYFSTRFLWLVTLMCGYT